MNLTTDEMKKAAVDFFKAAFCIDGEAKMRFDSKNFVIEGIVELHDSKRGTFYVARVVPKTKPL